MRSSVCQRTAMEEGGGGRASAGVEDGRRVCRVMNAVYSWKGMAAHRLARAQRALRVYAQSMQFPAHSEANQPRRARAAVLDHDLLVPRSAAPLKEGNRAQLMRDPPASEVGATGHAKGAKSECTDF